MTMFYVTVMAELILEVEAPSAEIALEEANSTPTKYWTCSLITTPKVKEMSDE